MNKILLIYAEGVQSICLAHSLRKQGHYVVSFCNHRIISGYATRWLNEKHLSPDITMHTEKFKQYLYNYLHNQRVDLIIPLADDGAYFLSKNKKFIEVCRTLKSA